MAGANPYARKFPISPNTIRIIPTLSKSERLYFIDAEVESYLQEREYGLALGVPPHLQLQVALLSFVVVMCSLLELKAHADEDISSYR